MFENLKVTKVVAKPVNDDIFSRSWRGYCKLSEPINSKELSRQDYHDLLDAVCTQLDIPIIQSAGPGRYFASVPFVYCVGYRMTIYQYAGYDV